MFPHSLSLSGTRRDEGSLLSPISVCSTWLSAARTTGPSRKATVSGSSGISDTVSDLGNFTRTVSLCHRRLRARKPDDTRAAGRGFPSTSTIAGLLAHQGMRSFKVNSTGRSQDTLTLTAQCAGRCLVPAEAGSG